MKKEIIIKFAVILIVIPTLLACPAKDFENSSFSFYNDSESNVYIYLGATPRTVGGVLYPDTLLTETNCFSILVKANKSYGHDFTLRVGRDTLSLFIIAEDTLKKYSWNEIKIGYRILRRYDLREIGRAHV